MAYTFFPESATDIKTTLKNADSKKVKEIIDLYSYLKKDYPKIQKLINIDPQKITPVNVTRQLQGQTEIAKIMRDSKIKNIKIKFGDGSSGGRGVGNKGTAYEGILAEGLEKWWAGEKVEPSLLETIEKISDLHKLEKCPTLVVKSVGELNNKRPFTFTGNDVTIGSKIPVTNNNLGKVVSDITLECGQREIYLSLKTGGTVTFFNSGIKTVLSPAEIKTGKITNEDGLKILKMFNINNALFCDIFNGKLKQGYSEDVWKTMKANQKTMLKNFLESGIGHGYTIVHKLSNETKVYKVTEKYMQEAATPMSCVVYYGGKGGSGKRIDMEIKTGHYMLKLNMRDTQGGDGYPTRMMCDYSYL
jgi:hypothetical protein